MDIAPLNSTKSTRAILDIGATKLYELIGDGSLVAVKDGGSTKITGDSIRDYIAGLQKVEINMSPRRKSQVR